jgi:hypothetical protein
MPAADKRSQAEKSVQFESFLEKPRFTKSEDERTPSTFQSSPTATNIYVFRYVSGARSNLMNSE